MMTPIPDVLENAIAEIGARNDRRTERSFCDEVKELREIKLGLTQVEFATRFGLSVANLRNWEQPSRNTQPDSSARLLIEMIKVDPVRVAEIVRKALEEKERKAREERERQTERAVMAARSGQN